MPSKPMSLRLLLVQSILVPSVACASRRSCRPQESATSVTSLPVVSTSTSDLSTSTDLASTSTDMSTSTDISITTSESSTSTETSSSSTEVTPTSDPVITTTSETEPAPTQTSLLLPSSTTAEPSTTTPEGPSLTTITDCPPTPTYNGNPEYCYQSKLPSACDRLTSAFFYRALSSSLSSCQAILTQSRYGVPPANSIASACFPTSVPAAPSPSLSAAMTSTASSVWSCLQTALLCEYDSNCATNTYTVGQVPTPTPSIGVNVLTNGGFEDGNFNDWTLSGFNQHETAEVSTARPRSGGNGVLVRFLNTNVASGNIQRTVRVEPGRQYSFTLWYYHENPGAAMSIYMYANPGGFQTDFTTAQLYQTPANQWFQRTLTFTPTTSFLQLQIGIVGSVNGGNGNPAGQNNVWIDDVALTRLN